MKNLDFISNAGLIFCKKTKHWQVHSLAEGAEAAPAGCCAATAGCCAAFLQQPPSSSAAIWSAHWGCWCEEDPLPYIIPGVGFSRNTIWDYHTFGDFSVIFLHTWSRLVLIFVGYKMCLKKTPYLVISKREQPKLGTCNIRIQGIYFFLLKFVMKGACFYLILFTLNILRDLEITGREMSDWISRLKLSSLNQSHMAIHCSRKKISEYQTSSFNQFLTSIFWD